MLALARKYRPKNFASVAVQSHVSNTLKGAIARGRVAHGYLLCGPRGTGKTTLARVLAMALNCERRLAAVRSTRTDGESASDSGVRASDQTAPSLDPGEPCGECMSCVRIWSGSASLDVVEIDAASNRGVDDARELRERAMYAPTGDDRYKVYIVDEAHMLTRDAWNALLKILEEPPPRVVFVFATTEPQKIAQTAAPVMSRLQRFDLKRIGVAEIRERLTAVLASERIDAELEAIAMIARAADGGLRDALSLTDQVISLGEGAVTASRVRDALGLVPEDEYLDMLELIADRRAGDVFGAVARLADMGVDFGGFLTGLADMIRAQLAVVLGGAAPDLSERARHLLEERRDRLAAADLLRMLNAVTEIEPRFRKSGQQQLLLETLLVRFALLDQTVSLEEVLRGLDRGDGGGGASSGARESTGDRPAAAESRRPRVPAAERASPADQVIERAAANEPAAPRAGRQRDDASLAAPRVPPAAPPDAAAAPEAPGAGLQPLDLNRLVERWDDIIASVRGAGMSLLATALEHASPTAVTGRGDVTLRLDEPNDISERAFESGKADLLSVIREHFSGVERVALRSPEGSLPAPKQRATHESVKTDRIAMLRRKDPVLGAAIEALDLDLIE